MVCCPLQTLRAVAPRHCASQPAQIRHCGMVGIDTTAGLIGSQSPCTACAKRLQGYKAFALFTSQPQRLRSSAEPVTAQDGSPRTAIRMRAAQQRPMHSQQSKRKLPGDNPARLRDDDAWQLRASCGQPGAAASIDDRVSRRMQRPIRLLMRFGPC